jgi:hypothetical protein
MPEVAQPPGQDGLHQDLLGSERVDARLALDEGLEEAELAGGQDARRYGAQARTGESGCEEANMAWVMVRS